MMRNFVSMDLAMEYLMNYRSIFDKVKDSFLESYQNYQEDYQRMVEAKDMVGLENYIHSIRGISLNLGGQLLYDSAVLALVSLKSNEWEEKSIETFYYVLDQTYQELKNL